MLRILSSAFGDLSTKFCHASKRIAEGEVDPGLKTESVEATGEMIFKMGYEIAKSPTRNF